MTCTQYPLTCTPRDVVRLHVLEDGGRAFLAGDIGDTADQHVELARQVLGELLDGGSLILGADDAGDGPRPLQEQWGEQLGNLAVAADEEDVMGGGHGWQGEMRCAADVRSGLDESPDYEEEVKQLVFFLFFSVFSVLFFFLR